MSAVLDVLLSILFYVAMLCPAAVIVISLYRGSQP